MVNKQKKLTAIFAALADPTRRKLLERLPRHGESRVTALAKPFGMSVPAISKHLRILENARLVKRHREGREHLIRRNPDGLKDAQKWMTQYIDYWDSAFDVLDEFLKTDQRKEDK